jgi:hypothetical protein
MTSPRAEGEGEGNLDCEDDGKDNNSVGMLEGLLD